MANIGYNETIFHIAASRNDSGMLKKVLKPETQRYINEAKTDDHQRLKMADIALDKNYIEFLFLLCKSAKVAVRPLNTLRNFKFLFGSTHSTSQLCANPTSENFILCRTLLMDQILLCSIDEEHLSESMTSGRNDIPSIDFPFGNTTIIPKTSKDDSLLGFFTKSLEIGALVRPSETLF